MSIAHLMPLITLVVIFIVFFFVMRVWFIGKAAKKDFKRISKWIDKSGDAVTQEELILQMAESYEKVGKRDKAIEHYDLYLFKKKIPEPDILFRIGNLYGMESYDKAKEYWEKAAEHGHREAAELLESLNKAQ